MKKLLLLITCSLLTVGVASAATLSERHQALGLKEMPAMTQCLSCHANGSYQALAEKTAKLKPNPHASHMADVQCDACHVWQGEPRLMCNDCHHFDYSAKPH